MLNISKISYSAIILLSSGFCSLVSAGSNTTAAVTKIYANPISARVYVDLAKEAVGSPACATNSYDFAFRVDDANGQGIQNLLTAAMLSGREVLLVGTGTCTVHTSMEDISYVVLQ